MSDFQQNLEKYAELAVKVGVNIQKGQTLVINTTLEAAELVRIIVRKAYETGANNVIVNWTDDMVSRTKYDLAPDEAFTEYPEWRAKEVEDLAKKGAAFMSVIASSPDLLKGVKTERIAAYQKAAGKALAGYRQMIQADKVSWTVIAAPSPQWAAKVFPEEPAENQVPKLWDAIFKATRVDADDPVTAW